MYSRRGTLLITVSAVATWALLNLRLSSAPCGSSFARPPRPFALLLSPGWPLNARLKRLHRNSFFSKGNGGVQVTADRKQRPLLYDKDEMDLEKRADTPFACGKHKFMTYDELVRDDPHYCAYIAELQDVRPDQVEIHDFQDYLQAINFEAPLSFPPTLRSRNAGKSFREVMETQPLYCSWVLSSEARSGPSLRRFRSFLKDESFETADMKEIIPFGLHQGKLYSEVMRDDPAWCTWVKSLEDNVSGSLLAFQTYLKEQGFDDVLEEGKHAGKTFKELMTEEPLYCKYMMSFSAEQGSTSSVMLRFRQYLEKEGLTSEDLLTSGKYSGKSFEEVMREDPSYCAWVTRLDIKESTKYPSMLKFKTFLGNQGFSHPLSEDVMSIGLHKGKTFEEVMTEDPSYCSWVMSLGGKKDEGNSSAMIMLKQYLEKKGFTAEDLLTSGKHKGKSFEEVMREDPSYCAWVTRLNRKESTKNPSMLKFKTFLENQGFSHPLSKDVMSIGLHKGKTFEEVMAEDAPYCTMVMDVIKEGQNIPVMVSFNEFLKQSGFQAAEDVMTVGKHKGKTFDKVMTADPSYCAYVTRLVAEGATNSVMLRLAKFLEKQGFCPPSPSEEVLGAGMHKGKKFAEVLQEDPSYCSWVMDQRPEGMHGIGPPVLRFRKFLEENGCSPPSEDIITSGVHKGKTFEEVLVEDPSYCGRVMYLSTQSVDNFSMLRFQKFLKDRGFQAPMPTDSKTSGKTVDNIAYTPANTVSFGKHKGKSFEEVMKEDPSYCTWVMIGEGACLLSFKTYLMENGFVDQS